MRMIILSALFALGLGMAGAPPASAAPLSGLNTATTTNPLVQQAQFYYPPPRRYRRYHRSRVHCRNVRVCRYSRYYHRRICRIERVCHRLVIGTTADQQPVRRQRRAGFFVRFRQATFGSARLSAAMKCMRSSASVWPLGSNT